MIFAAILAGGIGNRVGSSKPKQFLMVGDKPILVHSIEKFLKVDEIDKIIVSSPKSYINDTQELILNYFGTNDKLIIICGGETRNDTILNSISFIMDNYDDEDPILITHDAARIFVSPKIIKNSILELENHDASSAVIPAVDVIFESNKQRNLVNIPLRENLVHAQTPQSFKVNKFLEIYYDLSSDEIKKLDEAMMLFYLRGADVSLFDGDSINFKITRPIDLIIAEKILNDNINL